MDDVYLSMKSKAPNSRYYVSLVYWIGGLLNLIILVLSYSGETGLYWTKVENPDEEKAWLLFSPFKYHYCAESVGCLHISKDNLIFQFISIPKNDLVIALLVTMTVIQILTSSLRVILSKSMKSKLMIIVMAINSLMTVVGCSLAMAFWNKSSKPLSFLEQEAGTLMSLGPGYYILIGVIVIELTRNVGAYAAIAEIYDLETST